MALLGRFGAVVALDPITSIPIGVPWMADRCTANPQRSYSVAEFPIMAGYGLVTDAVLRHPPTLSVVFMLTDIAPLGHAIPSYRNRRYKMAMDFEGIETRLGPCMVWIPGYPPLRNYCIESSNPAPIDGQRAIALSVNFRRVNYTTLYMVPPGVSPDLLAAGILSV